MTILITGAAGFIGSNVCQKLLTKFPNERIIGIDNFSSYYDRGIKIRRIKTLQKEKQFIFIESSFYKLATLKTIQKDYAPPLFGEALWRVVLNFSVFHYP